MNELAIGFNLFTILGVFGKRDGSSIGSVAEEDDDGGQDIGPHDEIVGSTCDDSILALHPSYDRVEALLMLTKLRTSVQIE